MSEAKFQKKVLHLLAEMRNDISDLKGRRRQNEAGDDDDLISQSQTLDDFSVLENSIRSPEERRHLIQKLSLVGGINVKDNVKRILEKLMSNELMSKFNMKGNRQKMAFEKTGLIKVVQASAMKTFATTEQDVNVAVAGCLKYAPDRRGGTGRVKC
ncbi:uncharacterized protein LOC128550310 [Mercenaria mercenaria]|uniref:uncharacterized protein LOC128550310 n=1 Tax=Mercenaria mercenaria TaxID=6596 RepID=UPI00234E7FF1|nr:uncharacterized protein LOC128550310 [Mercenaria mercenaria]